MRPISRRVTPRCRNMPNSPRRASTCELVLALMPNRPIRTATASSRYVTAKVRSNRRERALADLAGNGDVVVAAARDGVAQSSAELPGIGAFPQPERRRRGGAFTAQRDEGVAVHDDRATRTLVVAPDAAHRRTHDLAAEGRSNSVPTSKPAQVAAPPRKPTPESLPGGAGPVADRRIGGSPGRPSARRSDAR